MPLAKLVFKIPEEQEEFDCALNGIKYKATLEELDAWLRGLEKYQDIQTISVGQVRDKIRELMND